MINFKSKADLARQAAAEGTVVVPAVTSTVTTRRPSASKTHLTSMSSTWKWDQLRDYVVDRIEKRHGPFPRDAKKEYGIFNGFVSRWGAQAGPIAEFAFEECGGIWKGAPISVNRFCKASDPYFATEIAARLS